MLLVANLVNKQAFYNQYWLVGALVVVSLALPASGSPTARGPSAVPATRSTADGPQTQGSDVPGVVGPPS